MTSKLASKGPLIIASSCVYVTACYIGYSAIQRNKEDYDETCKVVADGKFSFITNPKRNEQYQNVAKSFDDEIGRDEFVMGINMLRRSLLYFHAKGTVLEVGAGTGRNIGFYPTSCDRVLMVDASDKMLGEARKKIMDLSTEHAPNFACSVGDSSNLEDFPNQCFDTVVDTFGLCSYDDPVVVLREMKRVCKPEGKILLLEHGRSKTWNFITNHLDKNAERHAKNWGCVWNRDLDKILEQSGLKVDTLNTWHFGTTYYIGKDSDADTDAYAYAYAPPILYATNHALNQNCSILYIEPLCR
ncbi:S-adenosyl-L-methionine-dependent methyltransferase [Fragilariopsis cylindrus CCMP1102]|uniref:S-adenosyl-L-methionine-dependent methyltransferase n=1 Tax=Fragilariopsis cylindrus CCMP1102 TaxID=635003 RepID=A0A1E7F2P8_9STRA|nr:S-adenosyl-L-methionine-dependent methyltransferase [Fragilariopsis cylindrus CCMP1102]|eukprot:OEU12417.1 S-adenosyl-L-methionine-dependent methyltransferase [Fragilariopsis cylindrus CCMP1102]